jgi:hypothetical protein
VTYLDEADSPLGNESPDVARRYSKALCHLLDTEKSLLADRLHVNLRRVQFVLTNPHATARQRYKPLRIRSPFAHFANVRSGRLRTRREHRSGSGVRVEPDLDLRADPTDQIGHARVVAGDVAMVNRFVASDPISQEVQTLNSVFDIAANHTRRLRGRVAGKRIRERWHSH